MIGRAGLPNTVVPSGTSFITTDPAPITAPLPTLTPLSTTTFTPVHTSLPINVRILSF